jgi:DNA-binding MarR family transcriptional regulator
MGTPTPDHLLDRHLAAVLERIGELARAERWREAGELELTPLQSRIMGFVAHHDEGSVGVARVATELQLSRPTISDSVTLLVSKGLLLRRPDPRDGRRHFLKLSAKARRTWQEGSPLDGAVSALNERSKEGLLMGLMQVLHRLSAEGTVHVQRMCWTCLHYKGDRDREHHCLLLRKAMAVRDLRTDCSEHQLA